MAEVTRDLARDGVILGWRDELVSVADRYGAPELFRVERAATRHFGLIAYAAHLNGFTRIGGLLHLSIARRSHHEERSTPTGSTTSWAGASPPA